MKQIWEAFVARVVYLLTPRIRCEAPLFPGICGCGHKHCAHANGEGECRVYFPPSEGWMMGSKCACDVFILDNDDDGGDADPDTPTPSELEEIYSLSRSK